jgi:hypothetical protein
MDPSKSGPIRTRLAGPPAPSRMRALLVLGRVSNLPTVWSDCLAAWLLAGAGPWTRFAFGCLGATFLYTGGMFLNDAVDEAFDRRYRPERPIPSGRIGARTVWVLSLAWLLAGWVSFLPLGKSSTLIASSLLGAIVLYDLVHKQTRFAPLLMGACRFLLYLAAASASGEAAQPNLLWRAAALAAYIIGLSFLARVESTGAGRLRWTVILLFAPVFVALIVPGARTSIMLSFAAIQVAWTFWCLSLVRVSSPAQTGHVTPPTSSLKSTLLNLRSSIPRGVAGLLAGIVVVDCLAAAGHGLVPMYLALFVLALWLQRAAPAT